MQNKRRFQSLFPPTAWKCRHFSWKYFLYSVAMIFHTSRNFHRERNNHITAETISEVSTSISPNPYNQEFRSFKLLALPRCQSADGLDHSTKLGELLLLLSHLRTASQIETAKKVGLLCHIRDTRHLRKQLTSIYRYNRLLGAKYGSTFEQLPKKKLV